MRRPTVLFASLLLLTGCGLRQPLEPPPGETLPPPPAAATQPLTAEEMLTPPPIARPERVDELLRRSEEREDDRFELPPANVPPGGDTIEPDRSQPE